MDDDIRLVQQASPLALHITTNERKIIKSFIFVIASLRAERTQSTKHSCCAKGNERRGEPRENGCCCRA